MAKEIVAHIKLQIPAGQANPAPPVGTALGPRGVNIMAFCKEFNAATQKQAGDILPVVITVFKDKSFTFILKTPPASVLIKKILKLDKGSATPNKAKAQGYWNQVQKIQYERGGYIDNVYSTFTRSNADTGILNVVKLTMLMRCHD